MSYTLTIHVDHAELNPVTIEMRKVDDSHVSVKVSPQDVEEVKPIKGIQQELFRSLEQYYRIGLQSLSFTISQLGKKKTHEVACFDATTKLSSTKLNKAIKESVTKVKSSQVPKPKKAKKHNSTLVQPKRRKHVVAADNEEDDGALTEEEMVVEDNADGSTIVDGQGAIKKVNNKNRAGNNKQMVVKKQQRPASTKAKAKANVKAVPQRNTKGRVEKKAVVKTKGAVARNPKAGSRGVGGGAAGKKSHVTFDVSPNAVPVDATAAPVMNNGGAIAPPQILA